MKILILPAIMVILGSEPCLANDQLDGQSLSVMSKPHHAKRSSDDTGRIVARGSQPGRPSRSPSGGQDVGGGHVVFCQGKEPVTLDYFNAVAMNGQTSQKVLSQNSKFEEIFLERFNRIASMDSDKELDPRFREVRLSSHVETSDFVNVDYVRISTLIVDILKNLPPLDQWGGFKLSRVSDHKIIYQLPRGCSLRQGAIQTFAGSLQVSYLRNPAITNNLSFGQKELLRLHEALYTIVRRYLGSDSTPVRTLFEVFLLENPTDEDLFQALDRFRESLHISGQKYVCTTGYYPASGGEMRSNYGAVVRVFGRTMDEAAKKLFNFNYPNAVFCNLPRQKRGKLSCEELGSVETSCKVNESIHEAISHR